MASNKHYFRANSNLLTLLGDQLIGDDRLALFELVKNSYDADATKVDITFDPDNDIITIADDGCGMSIDTIINKWLEVGTASKRGKNREPSRIFKRLPLGEKGVGRLAVHKLGEKLELTSKEKDCKEVNLKIYWPDTISDDKQISDVFVEINERQKPFVFKNATGTEIKIQKLQKKDWTRGEVRKLKKMATTLISPFSNQDDFKISFHAPDYEHWLQDLFTVEDILNHSIWVYKFSITKDAKFSWSYSFHPPKFLNSLKERKKSENHSNLELLQEGGKKLYLEECELEGIGPIEGEFYIYDRRQKILSALPETKAIKDYLTEQTGVRVYRDGIRVYNYGEPGNDWLGLDASRINAPAKKMGNNSVIAAIHLDSDESTQLKEKTNREGFNEDKSYETLRIIIRSVISNIDLERREDRTKLDEALKSKDLTNKKEEGNFSSSILNIRKAISRNKEIEKEISPYIDKVEQEYESLQQIMLHSGLSGLNMTLVFHEIEREIGFLYSAIKKEKNKDDLLTRSSHLMELIDGFSPLLRKSPSKKIKISKLLKSAHNNTQGRFKYHDIIFSCPILSGEEDDIEITAPSNLLLGIIHNLIDNAIYWSRRVSEKPDATQKGAILISNVSDIFEVPSIAIIDNGPGFSISPEDAVKPFVYKKLNGSGLGLYFSHLVMQGIGGDLFITSGENLDVSNAHKGGAVVIKFPGGKNV